MQAPGVLRTSAKSCQFNGNMVPSGASVIAYSKSSPGPGESFVAYMQFRKCNNGVLSGSYTNRSCSATSPSATSCTFNGQQVASGQSVTAYSATSATSPNTCAGLSQTRTCNNGSLSGSYSYASCTNQQQAMSCTLPWGGSIASGATVTAYQSSPVPAGQSCASQSRTCSNGTLSGSYTYANCSTAAAQACTFNGQQIASGQSVTAYSSSSATLPNTCSGLSQTRTCNNGVLSGSYSNSECRVAGTNRGFDWFEFYGMPTDKNEIDTLKISTNMNIAHSFAALESPICANKTCAITISAGQLGQAFDICPGAPNHNACLKMNSWGNIWSLVAQIKGAKNQPVAIYFIDEPFFVDALMNGGKYAQYAYPSYVCTLRQAMEAHGVNLPIYTVLALGQSRDPEMVKEIQGKYPTSAACAGAKSRVDVIGVDYYDWLTPAEIEAEYQTVVGDTGMKWLLVPPATLMATPAGNLYTDDELSARICAYYKTGARRPSEVVAYMFFRYSPEILNGRPLDNGSGPKIYSKSRKLMLYGYDQAICGN